MSKEELQALKSSTYIYSHPDNIINKEEVYKILMSDVIQNKVWLWAHCVIVWGNECRPMFREIKRLRSVLPCAKILALSAALSTHGQKEISKHLLLKNIKVVFSKPTRNNISLIVVPRPLLTTLVSTKDTFDYVLSHYCASLSPRVKKFH